MHIAIDAHVVGERETGNETYTLNLIRALLRVTSRDPKGFSWDPGTGPDDRAGRAEPRRFGAIPQFLLLTPHPERLAAALPQLPPHASIRSVSPGSALLRIPLGLPISALRNAFDLLHVNYNAPPLSPCPTVVTIHDIAFEHYPEFFSPRDLLILKTLVPLSARRAARVITVSEHARCEILDRYGVPPHKVAVTYEAAGEQFQPVTDPAALEAVRDKVGVGRLPFVLALGNLQPRKNLLRLVEAFRRLAGSVASDLGLVIAGQAQWRQSDLFRAVAEAGLEERVMFPGYIADADLPALYSAACVFVYPSLYEGFGLPPLEAMACGTPVVCSNAASLPEVVGTAALTFDPVDVDALAQALATVLQDPAQAAELRRRGPERASQFSWEHCAVETLAVYRAASASKP
jgi:glycosyltransferase involved in cell wall biosynthesis